MIWWVRPTMVTLVMGYTRPRSTSHHALASPLVWMHHSTELRLCGTRPSTASAGPELPQVDDCDTVLRPKATLVTSRVWYGSVGLAVVRAGDGDCMRGPAITRCGCSRHAGDGSTGM